MYVCCTTHFILKLWNYQFPEAVKSGQVTFIEHNFLAPQPPLPPGNGAIVFFLRMIMHNWPDREATMILKHLRNAVESVRSTRKVRLVIMDGLLMYACRGNNDDGGGKESPIMREAPEPLIANWGAGNGIIYKFDVTVSRCLLFLSTRRSTFLIDLFSLPRCCAITMRKSVSSASFLPCLLLLVGNLWRSSSCSKVGWPRSLQSQCNIYKSPHFKNI